MIEEWKPIVGFEGCYEVSNHGRVRSLDTTDSMGRPHKGKIKAQYYGTNKYMNVSIQKNGSRKTCTVHRLVALAFHTNNTYLPDVNHKDLDKLNNYEDNLEWCTKDYNRQHAIDNSRMCPRTNPNMRKKLTPESVVQAKQLRAEGMYYYQIAKEIGVTTMAVHCAINGKTWKEKETV